VSEDVAATVEDMVGSVVVFVVLVACIVHSGQCRALVAVRWEHSSAPFDCLHLNYHTYQPVDIVHRFSCLALEKAGIAIVGAFDFKMGK